MSLLFDLDSYGAASQESEIDEMINDSDVIREHMNSRRAMMYQQMRADEIKSDLCDKLRTEKLSVPGLTERVASLEVTDPELFAYIRKLEFVQDGIWCTKCNTMKKIGGKPKVIPIQLEPDMELNKLREEFESLEKNLIITLKHLDTIQTEFQNKLKETSMIAVQIEKELMELYAKTTELGISVGAKVGAKGDAKGDAKGGVEVPIRTDKVKSIDMSTHLEDTMANRSTLPSINSTIKKEDLVAPNFNLDQLIEEKFAAMTADDLLSETLIGEDLTGEDLI